MSQQPRDRIVKVKLIKLAVEQRLEMVGDNHMKGLTGDLAEAGQHALPLHANLSSHPWQV